MSILGKLVVVSIFVAALCMGTWAATLYGERPVSFVDQPPPEGDIAKGSQPRYFKQMKSEIDALNRSAGVTSEAWGSYMKTLEGREKLRTYRQTAYAQRIAWAHKGNPNDNGHGFYEPVIDPRTNLQDLGLANGKPKGSPVKATDGSYLPGVDGILDSIAVDAEEARKLNADILAQRTKFDELGLQILATEERAIKMGVIRDNVQAELFFLQNFEVDVSETRETVFRRNRQLKARLLGLGVNEP